MNDGRGAFFAAERGLRQGVDEEIRQRSILPAAQAVARGRARQAGRMGGIPETNVWSVLSHCFLLIIGLPPITTSRQ